MILVEQEKKVLTGIFLVYNRVTILPEGVWGVVNFDFEGPKIVIGYHCEFAGMKATITVSESCPKIV